MRQFVAGQLRDEQRAGNVSSDLDTDFVAEMMVRISASFLVIPSDLVDLDDDEQLAAVARRSLSPCWKHWIPGPAANSSLFQPGDQRQR